MQKLEIPPLFWFVIAAVFINQIGNIFYIFLVPYTTTQLKLTLPAGASVLAYFGISMLVSSSIGGVLIDKYGSHKLLIASLFLNGLILLTFPLAKNYYHCALIATIWGFFYGLYRPSAQTFISLIVPSDSYQLIFVIYRFALNLGMSIGPAIGGYLALKHFALISVINGITNIIASSILIIALASFIRAKNKAPISSIKKLDIKLLKYNPELSVFMIGMVVIFMVFFQHQSPLALFLQDDLHFPLSFYGLVFTVNGLMIVLLELPLNLLTLKLSHKTNLIIGTGLITIGFSGMYYLGQKWQVMFLVVIWTLGEMILLPTASSYIAQHSTQNNRGRYMALYNTSMNFGMVIGPWVGVCIIQQYGYKPLWIICGLCGLTSIILFSHLHCEPKFKFLPATD